MYLQLLHSSGSGSGFSDEEEEEDEGKVMTTKRSKLSVPQQSLKSSLSHSSWFPLCLAEVLISGSSPHRYLIQLCRWFKIARISLEGELILWINLFVPWRTAHLRLSWSTSEIIGVRFSPFPLGKSWRLVPYDHPWPYWDLLSQN